MEDTTLRIPCECGTIMYLRSPSLVSVTKYPRLKKSLLDGSALYTQCPGCRRREKLFRSMGYMDEDKKFVVLYADTMDELMYNRYVKMDGTCTDLKRKGYKIVGVTSLEDFREKTEILEDGHDTRIAEILKYRLKQHSKNFSDAYYYNLDGNSKNLFEMAVSGGTNPLAAYILFNYSMYEETLKKHREVLKVNSFLFDEQSVLNLFRLESLPKKEHNYQFAVVMKKDRTPCYALIHPLMEGKIKEGDHVAIHHKDDGNDALSFGMIQRIIPMTEMEAPHGLDVPNKVIYKTGPLELTTEADSDSQLHNEILLDKIKSEGMLPFDLSMDTKMILGTMTRSYITHEKLMELVKKGTFTPGELHPRTFIKSHESEGKSYMAVYLDQSDVPDDGTSCMIHKFSDVLRAFFNRPGDFAGICINPETDGITISTSDVIQYMKNRIFESGDLMKEFLSSLTPWEKRYLGQKRYEVLSKIHLEGMDDDFMVMRACGISEDKILHERIETGYHRMEWIILSRVMEEQHEQEIQK